MTCRAFTLAFLLLCCLGANALQASEAILVLDCTASQADAALAKTITDIAVSTVSGGADLVAVSPESRAKALEELDFSLSGLSDAGTRLKIGEMTQATSVLSTKLLVDGGLWYLTVSQVDVEHGSVLSSSTETYRSAATLLEACAGQVRRCLGLQSASDDQRAITVGNMTELLQAIGPDRIIKIKPGNYDISQGFQVRNKYVSWVNEYDGPCPVIKSVNNLALVGIGNPVVMIKPAYGWVLSFDTCTGIRIDGLVLGHTVPGECMGGVIRLKNCDDVELRSCELYGSGTYGLGLERTSNLRVENCVIRDCTFGLMTIEGCSKLSFTGSVFKQTGEYELISIVDSNHLQWTDCSFTGNRGSVVFAVDDQTRDLQLTRCGFTGNRISQFTDNPDTLRQTACSFSGNLFK